MLQWHVESLNTSPVSTIWLIIGGCCTFTVEERCPWHSAISLLYSPVKLTLLSKDAYIHITSEQTFASSMHKNQPVRACTRGYMKSPSIKLNPHAFSQNSGLYHRQGLVTLPGTFVLSGFLEPQSWLYFNRYIALESHDALLTSTRVGSLLMIGSESVNSLPSNESTSSIMILTQTSPLCGLSCWIALSVQLGT